MGFLNGAEIYTHAAARIQTGIGTDYIKLGVFDSNGESKNCTVDAANGQITIGDPGFYLCVFYISFSGENNTIYEFDFAINGVALEKGTSRKTVLAAEVGAAPAASLVKFERGDVVTMLVKADGAAKSITVENVGLVLVS